MSLPGPVLSTLATMVPSRRKPDPPLRSIAYFWAFVAEWRSELRRIGISNPKGSHFGLLTGSVYLGVALAGSLLPTWPGEAAPYFLAVVGLTGAWVIAAPQLASAMATMDLKLVIARLMRFDQQVRARAAGPPTPPGSQQRPEDEQPRVAALLRHGLPYFAAVMLTRQVLGVAPVLAVAIVGIMVAPHFQAFHWGFWHPVALWYSAPLPYVLSIVVTIPMLMVARLYVAADVMEARVRADHHASPGDDSVPPSDAP